MFTHASSLVFTTGIRALGMWGKKGRMGEMEQRKKTLFTQMFIRLQYQVYQRNTNSITVIPTQLHMNRILIHNQPSCAFDNIFGGDFDPELFYMLNEICKW